MPSMRCATAALLLAAAPAAPPSLAAEPGETRRLELAADLDHRRGYCLDIPGYGPEAMLWKPLIAHNCKPGQWGDQQVAWDGDGTIRFPAYDRCVTAAGVKHASLPGAAVMVRACRDEAPLQRFRHRADGRIEQADSGLCLTAGARSRPTWNPDHRWRVLSLQACAKAPEKRSVWLRAEPPPIER